ncbi:MAG: TetR/AcrR family transcriptional regulator [Chloroflexota bacterium]
MPDTPYHHGNLYDTSINIALRLLSEGGADAVTMREIGRQADVSPSAIYRHFANKGALLAAIAEDGFNRLADIHREIRIDESSSTGQRFRRMGVEYILFAAANAEQYRLMYGSDAVQREAYPNLDRAAQRLSREVLKMIKVCQYGRVLRRGDARQMAYTVWAMSHGAAMLVIDGHVHVTDLPTFADNVTESLRVGIERHSEQQFADYDERN